jgi:hypothetical protein
MKPISKFMILIGFLLFLTVGTARAFPFTEVEGFVNRFASVTNDNGEGATTFEDFEYTSVAGAPAFGAKMDWMSFGFERDILNPIASLKFVKASHRKAKHWPFSGSRYEITSAETHLDQEELLVFTDDLVVDNSALGDPELWQGGPIWTQPRSADRLGGGDGGPITPVPEPATMLLFGSGMLATFAFGRRRFFTKKNSDREY